MNGMGLENDPWPPRVVQTPGCEGVRGAGGLLCSVYKKNINNGSMRTA